jgi:hypothetical protein
MRFLQQRAEECIERMNHRELCPNWACCHLFASAIEMGGKGDRGIGVFVARTPVGSHFVLQSRGVSSEDERLIRTDLPIPYAVNISARWGIAYCPWCGYSLKKLMDEHPDDFEALANAHKALLPSWSVGDRGSKVRLIEAEFGFPPCLCASVWIRDGVRDHESQLVASGNTDES